MVDNMKRSKKILVTSHCIFNQNTVIPEEARAFGAIPSAAHWAISQGYGIIQLPCPEFTFLGLDRPPMTYDQYNTIEYREHCRSILQPIVKQIVDYHVARYELVGTLGIGSSPSCDPSRGVFMEVFRGMLKEHEIDLSTWWYLPAVEDPIFDASVHVKTL